MQGTTQTDTAERDQRLGVAFTEGRIAGNLLLAAPLNPYPFGEPEHAEWERGRSSATAQRAVQELARRARTALCRYVAGQTCGCGGRGLCLDVA